MNKSKVILYEVRNNPTFPLSYPGDLILQLLICALLHTSTLHTRPNMFPSDQTSKIKQKVLSQKWRYTEAEQSPFCGQPGLYSKIQNNQKDLYVSDRAVCITCKNQC